MPFHEIREVSFSDRFNSVWNRRQKPETPRAGRSKRTTRGNAGKTPDPAKEIDIWA